jgi:DNA polymerase
LGRELFIDYTLTSRPRSPAAPEIFPRGAIVRKSVRCSFVRQNSGLNRWSWFVQYAPQMDSAARNRIKLWLRSERAFGLNVVPMRERSEPVEPVMSGRKIQEPPRTEAPTSGGLFGDNGPPIRTVPPPPLVPLPTIEPFAAETLPTEEKRRRLIAMDANEVRCCTRCRLCETRKNTVFGEGSVDAKIFFIGEGPGENEDLQGRPFVGRAGEMLNKWIAAMGLRREDVYIANIVKCRPPGNRVPMPDEVATCTPYLQRQIEIIRPRVIVTLGLPALKYMTNDPRLTMGRSRGQWREWRGGIKLMPTFHPAYVLRSYNDETRAAVWSDLKMVMAEIGLPLPTRK